MSYQESFITTAKQKDFNDFAAALKALGSDYFTEHGFFPAHAVAVKQDPDRARINV